MAHHSLQLSHRIVLIVVCLCITQSLNYRQPPSREVVKFRLPLILKEVQASEFTPIAKLLAVKRKNGTVRIIDVTDGRERRVLVLPNKKSLAMHLCLDCD